ncbi:30S ribosomal protein S16 [bacterium HR07]|uniref:Small ribosomal subunit protein bS16 n=1 Tax=Acetithermum autotrophicum TaxID=1446466 RepID=H5STB0_ACEAU|nr:30S ribosomal protein S16 [Candidatus Acetothermum autotrophicum]GBC76391.1 30S ribosomal protein S16 [bacterium HR07]
MAVKIRLKRIGRRAQPSYRVVVVEETKPRDSQVLADLGWYDALHGQYEIDTATALQWLSRGAQPSPTARHLLSKKGILAEFHKQRQGQATP